MKRAHRHGDIGVAGDQDDGDVGIDRVDRARNSSPSIPGMRMSVTTIAPVKSLSYARAARSARSEKASTAQTRKIERLDIRLAQRASSSTKKIVCSAVKKLMPRLNVRRKPAPPSGEGIRVRVPPNSAMMSRAMARPRPSPSGLAGRRTG
jgi:hypothetical protein